MATEEAQFEHIIEDILADGFGILDNFLSETEVENLLEAFHAKYKSGIFKQANIGKKAEEKTEITIRGDQILWLNKETSNMGEQAFFQKISAFIRYLNSTCYLGITNSEFHFAKYTKGKFYKRHLDGFQAKKGRVLSVIVYLNIHWQVRNGGNLVIYSQKNGIDQPITIQPLAGRLVCFESEKLEHEVQETFADRLSITGWLLNN